MNVIDWGAALSAVLGAALVVVFIRRWRSHDRQRSMHWEFDWHSKSREELDDKKRE